jgi:hypothetical protein
MIDPLGAKLLPASTKIASALELRGGPAVNGSDSSRSSSATRLQQLDTEAIWFYE